MKFRTIQIVCPDSRYRKRSDCLYRLSGKITNYDQPLAVGCCKSQKTSSGPVGCLHQPGERAPRIKEFRMFPPQLQQFCICIAQPFPSFIVQIFPVQRFPTCPSPSSIDTSYPISPNCHTILGPGAVKRMKHSQQAVSYGHLYPILKVPRHKQSA